MFSFKMFQRSEILYLRKLLEECDLCAPGKKWNNSVTDIYLQFCMVAQAKQAATSGSTILQPLFQYF